jgi:DNA mismatch endonuclease (patch repair protein)
MKAVGTKHTGPELVVRRMLFCEGYRYRLHKRDLPGTPDIVFSTQRKAIFVNGCFWHGHGCHKGQAPKSKDQYWGPKLEANRLRDARNIEHLNAMGWTVLVVWQCELKAANRLRRRLIRFLGTKYPRSTSGKKVAKISR